MAPRARARPIHTAIVSPQEVVVRGLTAMLADFPERVMVVQLPSVWVSHPHADVVVYDTLPLRNDAGAALDHLVRDTDVRILLYSRDLRPDLLARAQAQGCLCWVSMSSNAQELVDAVELAAAGGRSSATNQRLGHEAGLTSREAEVLSLIARGFSNQQIAERLFLSINTLKTHIKQTYKRIGVTSRSQAVVWSLQHGFAADEPPPAGPSSDALNRRESSRT